MVKHLIVALHEARQARRVLCDAGIEVGIGALDAMIGQLREQLDAIAAEMAKSLLPEFIRMR